MYYSRLFDTNYKFFLYIQFNDIFSKICYNNIKKIHTQELYIFLYSAQSLPINYEQKDRYLIMCV